MNEQILKLIEDLAHKMGTTAEHLWKVLIRQARIEAWVGLLELVASLGGAFILGNFALRCVHLFQAANEANNSAAGFYFVAILACFIGTSISAGIFIGSLGSLGSVIAGFINPEYWAFTEVASLFDHDIE